MTNELPLTVGEAVRETGSEGGETLVCGPMPSHEDLDHRVYSVATDQTINSLMSQYKKRKQVRGHVNVSDTQRETCDYNNDVLLARHGHVLN